MLASREELLNNNNNNLQSSIGTATLVGFGLLNYR